MRLIQNDKITKSQIQMSTEIKSHYEPERITATLNKWKSAWETSLAHWSKFTRLQEPRWCLNEADEKAEGLSSSFAMIRLDDHVVVVSIERILDEELEDFPEEILAHEIGHHILIPANLTDHGRMIARMKRALPTVENHAPFIANLYGDLLINDRLQRQCGLNEAGVYQQLNRNKIADAAEKGETYIEESRLWAFYMRTFEILWSLPKNSLALGKLDDTIEGDALLASRIVRVYGNNWLIGAGKFAALCLSYLLDEKEKQAAQKASRLWLDMEQAGNSGMPDGLTEMDEDELLPLIHPALDDLLNGNAKATEAETNLPKERQDIVGGQKKIDRYRGPQEYGDLLTAMGVNMTKEEKAMRYYRERAMPHLIPFPSIQSDNAKEKSPEGFTKWNIGSPLERVDWFQSIIRSPLVIPGVTTVERVHGVVEGQEREKVPIDLYIGIDCSGSMPNPRHSLSYPTLAASIMALSAFRANARVMACLSGEPGESIATEGFIRDEATTLKLLTDYLGTGYAFGIHRLTPTFQDRKPNDRPVHILVITDQDIFSMLDDKQAGNGKLGWDVAKMALEKARAGATFVLNMPYGWRDKDIERMKKMGWNVYRIADWNELIDFARDFSHKLYAEVQDLK